MNQDLELLRKFVRTGDETAFARIMEEQSGLVFHTALRRLNGDYALAQDATQTVFVDLVKKAESLPTDTILAGWLHRQTIYVTSKQVRTEDRRRVREQTVGEDGDQVEEPGHLWREIKSLVDRAINQLGETEQNLVLLRYWNGMGLREAGKAIGLSENAAQKRLARAVEKLRSSLSRYGITGSVATLTLALSENAMATVPPSVISSVSGVALAAKASGSSSFVGALNPLDWLIGLKAKPVIATALSLMAISLGTTGFVAGRTAAQRHHTATHWQGAVDQAAADIATKADSPVARIESPNTVDSSSTNEPPGIRAPLTVREIVQQAAVNFRTRIASHNARALAYINLSKLSPEQVDEAIRELEQYRGESKVFDGIGPILTGLLARRDPSGAYEFACTNFNGHARGLAVVNVIRAWGKKNPPEAWKWYHDVTASGELPIRQDTWRSAANNIFTEWTSADPVAAFSQLEGLSVTAERAVLSGIADAALGSPRRGEILELISQMPDERLKRRVAQDLAGDWGRLNPHEASAWAATLKFEDPTAHLEVLGEVAEEWFVNDPHEAAKWLLANTPAPLKQKVTGLIGQAFMRLETEKGGSSNKRTPPRP